MSIEDWSPDQETPEQIQKRAMDLMRECIDAQKLERERADAFNASPPVALGTYTPPTFEQVSNHILECWNVVKDIMPNAPENVQALAFQSLLGTSIV